jgi:hypothetical protein
LGSHPRLRRWRWLSDLRGLEVNARTTRGVLVLSLARHCFNFATLGLLYQSISGAEGSFLAGGLVYALTSPVRMVNFTPGNLGVNEWMVAIVGKGLAFDVATGLIVALVFRGIGLAAQGLALLIGWAWLAVPAKPPAAS